MWQARSFNKKREREKGSGLLNATRSPHNVLWIPSTTLFVGYPSDILFYSILREGRRRWEEDTKIREKGARATARGSATECCVVSCSLVCEIVISVVLPSLTGWRRLVNFPSGATHEVKFCWSHTEPTHHEGTAPAAGTFVARKGSESVKTNVRRVL